MLSSQQIDQAAQHLLVARKTKTLGPLIPESCRPTDNESALAIQQRVLELLGEPIGGWKCGVPGPTGALIVAWIPESGILRSSPVAVPVPPAKGLIEPEIAFVLSKDLPAKEDPYTDDEIRGAIGEARFALELLGTRYVDKLSATPVDLLADSFNNHALLVGPVIPDVLNRFVEMLQVTITAKYPDGDKVLVDKVGAHPSGHPMKSFSWLVHFLNKQGKGLKAGQIITTGSYAGIVEAPVGVPLHIELGDLGTLDTELVTDKP